MLTVEVTGRRELRFEDGAPVRSASAVARLGDGWLVAQDDATSGAWLADGGGPAVRLRLLPPVDGHDLFGEEAGTKRAKPDLEAAVELPERTGGGVLLLGSGSLANRRRAVLVDGAPLASPAEVVARDLPLLYDRVAEALGLDASDLNLEGACVVGDRLRWFQRGLARGGVPSASVELDLEALLAAVRGDTGEVAVEISGRVVHDLGAVAGVALAVTDAASLPDGRVVVAASAEDAPDAVADGPVSGSAVALLDGPQILGVAALSGPEAALKLEGLAVVSTTSSGATLLGVVDQDDPTVPSVALDLELAWR